VTGAANDSAGHNNRCREQSALSKAGWSTTWPTSDTFVGDVQRFAGRAENWNSATRHSRTLIRYLQGRQAADRAGCLRTPTRRAPDLWGPEPFAPSPERGALRSSREAPSRAAVRPVRGFAANAAPGKGAPLQVAAVPLSRGVRCSGLRRLPPSPRAKREGSGEGSHP
jgi:hypothetical protein